MHFVCMPTEVGRGIATLKYDHIARFIECRELIKHGKWSVYERICLDLNHLSIRIMLFQPTPYTHALRQITQIAMRRDAKIENHPTLPLKVIEHGACLSIQAVA